MIPNLQTVKIIIQKNWFCAWHTINSHSYCLLALLMGFLSLSSQVFLRLGKLLEMLLTVEVLCFTLLTPKRWLCSLSLQAFCWRTWIKLLLHLTVAFEDSMKECTQKYSVNICRCCLFALCLFEYFSDLKVELGFWP